MDGPQHFRPISNWQSPEKIQKNDKKKDELAIENGYSMIRIPQETVWDDLDDWKIQLKKAIDEIEEKSIIKIGLIYEIKK